jgi:4-hydroxybenzoate polyprenyltransferase
MAPPPRKRQRRAPPAARPRTPPRPTRPVRPADSSTRATRVLDALLRPLPPRWREKAADYLVLTRMDRPIGALLLLWPTWWALWLAAGDFPPWGALVIFTLGVFVMRSAGCAINDFADRKLDPQVARTAGRPLASGRISPREALLVFAVLLLVAFGLVLLTNPLTIQLAFAGAALAAIYPFTKRWTYLPQVVLGAAFGWSIPMAFAAVTGSVSPLGWLLFLGNILWSVIYDTEYAMVDRDDDLKVGAKSTAILFGDADVPILGMLIGTFLLAMLFVGQRAQLGLAYWLALLAAAGLFGYQLWLIRRRARDACLAAFRHNNWVGLTLWVGIVLALAVK